MRQRLTPSKLATRGLSRVVLKSPSQGREQGWSGSAQTMQHSHEQLEPPSSPDQAATANTASSGAASFLRADTSPIGVVEVVMPDGPAQEAGLEEGDVIIAMGDAGARAVAAGCSLLAAISDEISSKAAEGAALDVTVLRRAPDFSRHCCTVRLHPKLWDGEGLLGMRISHVRHQDAPLTEP
jgi:hypothetical protein